LFPTHERAHLCLCMSAGARDEERIAYGAPISERPHRRKGTCLDTTNAESRESAVLWNNDVDILQEAPSWPPQAPHLAASDSRSDYRPAPGLPLGSREDPLGGPPAIDPPGRSADRRRGARPAGRLGLVPDRVMERRRARLRPVDPDAGPGLGHVTGFRLDRGITRRSGHRQQGLRQQGRCRGDRDERGLGGDPQPEEPNRAAGLRLRSVQGPEPGRAVLVQGEAISPGRHPLRQDPSELPGVHFTRPWA